MRRSFGLLFMVAATLPLAFAATAGAQGSVLSVTPKSASPGQAVNVQGTSFSASGASPVFIRLSTRDGQVLRETTPQGASGRIDATFPIPSALAPGTYLLLATQTNDVNGRMKSFTPGRTTLRVVAPGAAAAGARAAARKAGPLPGGTIGGPAAPLAPAVSVLALTLLAAGAALLVVRRRSRVGRAQIARPTEPGSR